MSEFFARTDILSILMLLPLLGALGIGALFSKDNDPHGTRSCLVGAVFGAGLFLLSLGLLTGFPADQGVFKFGHEYFVSETLGLKYSVGIDGASLWMILLTTLLTPVSILAGRHAIGDSMPKYVAAFLALEALSIGVFAVRDVFAFYVFFEASLIPMYLIIGRWGGENRVYASYKFFLYTLAGSLLFLLALLYLRTELGSSSMEQLSRSAPSLPVAAQYWLFAAFLASFSVKIPMWPVHTWLPDAHVQAPTGGSVMLAGVLLKLGGYGLLRLSMPFFPQAALAFADFINILSVIAIVYGAFTAFAQKDMKKLVAYSSVSHMGYVTLGLFSFTEHGIAGAILVMISHGLVSAALFFCVGVLYDRMHTKEIAKYGGVVTAMPVFATLFLFFCMASAGLPGTSGFVGEFLTVQGAFSADNVYACVAATGVVFGAVYILSLYKRVVFGAARGPEISALRDVEPHEYVSLAVTAVPALVFGVFPFLLTDSIKAPAAALAALFK